MWKAPLNSLTDGHSVRRFPPMSRLSLWVLVFPGTGYRGLLFLHNRREPSLNTHLSYWVFHSWLPTTAFGFGFLNRSLRSVRQIPREENWKTANKIQTLF